MADTSLYHRKSIRLKSYDYSLPGSYFITILTHTKNPVLGTINANTLSLTKYGVIVSNCWKDLVNHYRNLELDSFIIMPNHIHGIIVLQDMNLAGSNVRAGLKPAPTKNHSLSEIVRGFKTFSSRQINTLRKTPGVSVWQRNYYERVIRNDDELNTIRRYIHDNAINWESDIENHDDSI